MSPRPATETSENTPPHQGRRPLACQRCRRRKVRCDALTPSCSNCLKAGVPCTQVQGADRNQTHQLESRIKWLETIVRHVAPDVPIDADSGFVQSVSQPSCQSPGPGNLVQRGALPLEHTEDEYNFSTQAHQADLPGFQLGPAEQAPKETAHGVDSNLQHPIRTAGHSPVIPSHTSHISAEQPLAQSVGLISLAHSSDPKYLGPSSGVSFARLIFAAAPPSQGLPIFSSHFNASANAVPGHATSQLLESNIVSLPPITEVRHFVAAYIDAFHYLYPFLSETMLEQLIDRSYASSSGTKSGADVAKGTHLNNTDRVLLYLVIALGARTIESQMNTDFSSDSYLATAMDLMSTIQLHESIKGVQVMLLLVLATFIFPNAPNAWFLLSTIIASCVDLGLQRKDVLSHASGATEIEQNIRSGVFWSAYSLDRTLCTTLGRPLTLRDEAIDIEYPGERGSNKLNLSGVNAARSAGPCQQNEQPISPAERLAKRRRLELGTSSPFASSIFAFRFDRIVAEIKLMIYRVAQIPERFPWPTDLREWQQVAYQALQSLLDETRHTLMLPTIELKYNHCVTILFRPSPAFPRPTAQALRICFESASETVQIHSDLLRFGKLNNSWLTAHTVFVSGITMLYYAWVNPQILQTASSEFYRRQKSCSDVLAALGRTWSVARDARNKFDRLVQMTKEARAESNHDRNDRNPRTRRLLGCSNALWDELGNMRSWFDLEWFGEANMDVGGGYIFN
ncbi:hypothetical protein K469DRAFT_728575 [Zopfia rhizophila CBS 207.26]|uniref:Zn(2)-C6 fungal-type domain-containing protein n=1 Tax=Zopfia rhizophila CBS 207.26 TaxID=1314779 RepID=A0A6A6DTJ4_9PEZI|nr:hypothetical protein K469DRAFT_728575 [Zopfia rhizophila CBS 207.26]